MDEIIISVDPGDQTGIVIVRIKETKDQVMISLVDAITTELPAHIVTTIASYSKLPLVLIENHPPRVTVPVPHSVIIAGLKALGYVPSHFQWYTQSSKGVYVLIGPGTWKPFVKAFFQNKVPRPWLAQLTTPHEKDAARILQYFFVNSYLNKKGVNYE
jgi:hypothetical protein